MSCIAEAEEGCSKSSSALITALIKSLSFLDRYLALWIVLAMIIGVVCGYFIMDLPQAFSVVDIQGTSLPIAFGLWFMMWPVLSKVSRYLIHVSSISHSSVSVSARLHSTHLSEKGTVDAAALRGLDVGIGRCRSAMRSCLRCSSNAAFGSS